MAPQRALPQTPGESTVSTPPLHTEDSFAYLLGSSHRSGFPEHGAHRRHGSYVIQTHACSMLGLGLMLEVSQLPRFPNLGSWGLRLPLNSPCPLLT